MQSVAIPKVAQTEHWKLVSLTKITDDWDIC